MSETGKRQQARRTLAARKAVAYSQRDDLAAVAITGSVARGQLWAGSDVDLWGFSHSGQEAFEDGVEVVNGEAIYWEIDIAPMEWLQQPIEEESWLRPPGLVDEDAISLVEALWGCQIVKDRTGALYRVQQAIDSRVADRHWLRQRAGRYLAYGRGALEGLHYAPPLEAIILAREAATRYGIAAYWMRAGGLLTSVMRIPERLAHAPEIHRLYREIYGLGGPQQGQGRWQQFLEAFDHLPAEVQETAGRDLRQEVQPVAELGLYDGALRYMRALLPTWFGAEVVRGVLGLPSDLEVGQRRVFQQTAALLDLCGTAN